MQKKSHIHSTDLRGLADIVTDATLQVTNLAEDLNHRIVHPPYLPSSPIQHLITGIAGIVYSSVRYTTKLVANGLDKTLSLFHKSLAIAVPFDKKEVGISIVNGIIGDYLDKQNNPLTLKMQFRHLGVPIAPNAASILETYPNVSGKILLIVHGLCMSDIGWKYKGHNHGEDLARELNMTPVYLNYNSGLHISTNGKKLNLMLEELLANWPVPVEEFIILSHSLGGLISRSAIYYGQKEGNNWQKQLKKMFFLASPHQGAPLERIGNYVERFLEAMPYLKPFSRLGKMRSSGITDLRFSNLVDEDWKDIPRFEGRPDNRQPIPLPQHTACYAVAATIGKQGDTFSAQTIGDGLVQLESALGMHKNPIKNLGFPKANTFIAYETNHLDLLGNLAVYEQLKYWLSEK